MYYINIEKHALKELEQIPKKDSKHIIIAIEKLATNPRPLGSKKLKGEREYIWQIRIGNYRVLYCIDDSLKILGIRKIGHRKKIYK